MALSAFPGVLAEQLSDGFEAVWIAVRGRKNLNNLEECNCGMGKGGLAAVDKAELSLNLKFFDADSDERTRCEFILYG